MRRILTVSYFQAIYVRQELRFRAPVKAGNTVVARATVTEIQAERRRVVLSTVRTVEDKVVLDGEATIMVSNRPTQEPLR